MRALDIASRLAWPAGPGAFRLWLALAVVLHHFTRIEFGKAPVLIFFVLSGYWVHRVWRSRYAGLRQPYLTFMVSRWWRIAPVLVLASVMTFLVLGVIDGGRALGALEEQVLPQLFSGVFGIGYANLPTRPLGPAWSLDIEMQFYLAAPLLIAAVRRLSWVGSLLAAYLVQQLSLLLIPGMVFADFLPFFVVGMVAAEHEWSPTRRTASISLAVTVAALLLALSSPWRELLLGETSPNAQLFNILLAMLAIPLAIYTVGQTSDRTDGVMADHSYLIYLLHWPAILVYRQLDWSNGAATAGGAFALFVTVCLASWLTRRLVDRPLQRRRARWVAERRGPRGLSVRPPGKGDDIAVRFA